MHTPDTGRAHRIQVLVASLALVAGAADAGTIASRRDSQQHRIAQGIRSGQLTSREAVRIERREARLGREVHLMRSANCGPLTLRQRAWVNRRLDRLSTEIYVEKHDRQRRP
jgi:hypothetical protein